MDPFIGELRLFPYNFAPRGWAFCQGQVLSIAQNTALFSLLGTTYGGNGTTTFALPDLQGRTPVSAGQGPGLPPYSLGQIGGQPSVTLTQANLPAHTHGVNASAAGSSKSPGGNVPGYDAAGSSYGSPDGTQMNGQMVQPAGGNQPFSVQPPYLTLNWCIALEGIYPSRN